MIMAKVGTMSIDADAVIATDSIRNHMAARTETAVATTTRPRPVSGSYSSSQL